MPIPGCNPKVSFKKKKYKTKNKKLSSEDSKLESPAASPGFGCPSAATAAVRAPTCGDGGAGGQSAQGPAFGRQLRVARVPGPGVAVCLGRTGLGGASGGGRLCVAGRPPQLPPPSLPQLPQPRRPASRRCGPARTPAPATARLSSGREPARPRTALPWLLTPGPGVGSSSASRSNSHRAGMAGTWP